MDGSVAGDRGGGKWIGHRGPSANLPANWGVGDVAVGIDGAVHLVKALPGENHLRLGPPRRQDEKDKNGEK
ncbi:MAG: hypothetical protein HY318_13905 [Armatimonadetes bacterium]|nr:hypothetical protein [Armatimonadota bacterium]